MFDVQRSSCAFSVARELILDYGRGNGRRDKNCQGPLGKLLGISGRSYHIILWAQISATAGRLAAGLSLVELDEFSTPCIYLHDGVGDLAEMVGCQIGSLTNQGAGLSLEILRWR